MSWVALAYIAVIFVMLVTTLFLWVWPRTPEGKLMDPDEVDEYVDHFDLKNAAPSERAGWVLIFLFVTLAMLGVALTKRRD